MAKLCLFAQMKIFHGVLKNNTPKSTYALEQAGGRGAPGS